MESLQDRQDRINHMINKAMTMNVIAALLVIANIIVTLLKRS